MESIIGVKQNRILRWLKISNEVLNSEGILKSLTKLYKKILKKLDYELNDFEDKLKRPLSIFISRATKKQLYYVIGDSHARLFKNNFRFIVYHIGPATAFNLKKINNTIQSNEKITKILLEIKNKNNPLLFVFGEIDCREHIYYQYLKNKKKISLQKLIDNTVNSYIDFLINIKEDSFKIIVLGIPPASTSNEYYYNFDFRTPLEVRSKINYLFNTSLEASCKKFNINYINIYDFYKDKKGYLDNSYTYDGTHLSKKTAQKIKKLIYNSSKSL